MNKLCRGVVLAVAGLAMGLTGCISTTRVVKKTSALAPDKLKKATVEELEQALGKRDSALTSLNAQVQITATTGGSRQGKVTEYTSFHGYIFVKRPEMLRVILQIPVLGSRALDMVSDGKTFTMVQASTSHGDQWRQGSNLVTKPSKNGLENLRPPVFLDSLLVPGVTPDEFVTLTESSRVVVPEDKHHDAIEEPDYDLTVLKKKAGNVMVRERVLHISRADLLPFQQDIYEGGRVVTQATYEKYQTTGATPFPMLITIVRPLDEYSLKVEVTKLTENETFEADQFELKVPAGVTVKRMD